MKSLLFAFLAMTVLSCSFAMAADPAPAGSVVIAEPAAPPAWAEKLIVSLSAVPVVGPILSKALLYAGIVSSSLTAIIAFLLSSIAALGGVLKISGLAEFAAKLEAFKNGKIMYYLKYLSMFNANKPDDKPKA
jgi:hypothetical protein